MLSNSSGDPAGRDKLKAGETASKVADAARHGGDQAKQTASSLASDATKQAKGFLNMQVTAGADMVDHVVDSARIAAENLEQQAPQLAGLVRSVADRAEEFSQDLRGQTLFGERTSIRGEAESSRMAGAPAQEEIDEPADKFLRPRSDIAISNCSRN